MADNALFQRRSFLQAALGAATAKRRPNIVVVMSDEHNHRVAGCYGNRLARTPRLDELAGRGVTFDNAYCNSSLCAPSRLSFTAGKYIHRVGAWNNNCRLPSNDYPSLPSMLNAAGYDSFLCGKQHYDATHRYGFTEIGGNMNRIRMRGKEVRRDAGDTSVDPRGLRRFQAFRPGEKSSTMAHDLQVTAGTKEFLANRTRREKPFFLFVGYLAPHFPLVVPESYWANYRGRIAMPEIPSGFIETLPLNYQHLRRGFGMVDIPAETVMRGRELYFGLTEWMDAQVGQVLDALHRSPFADDTVVIYTSDHGENMGEHGMWWKNCMYEQASHIPLIVSWPRRWKGGQRRTGTCSLLDLVQTIAEIGGARLPSDWDGSSLLPWLDAPGTKWKDVAVSQYYAHNIASGFSMIRTGDWKYVYHAAPDAAHPAERELYNLRSDPMEFRNLAGEKSQLQRREKLHAALLKELGEDPEETERRCRIDCAKGYGA